jgi:hypothetical protein
VVALFATVITAAQWFSAHDIAQMPTFYVYKLYASIGTNSLLLALASGIGNICKWTTYTTALMMST